MVYYKANNNDNNKYKHRKFLFLFLFFVCGENIKIMIICNFVLSKSFVTLLTLFDIFNRDTKV